MRGKKSTWWITLCSVATDLVTKLLVVSLLLCQENTQLNSDFERFFISFRRDYSETLHTYIARFRVTTERVEEREALLPEPLFP